jgi:hypothetical protein
LRTVRPAGAAERVRKQIAADLVVEIRSLDSRLKANAEGMAELVNTTTAVRCRRRVCAGGSVLGPDWFVARLTSV